MRRQRDETERRTRRPWKKLRANQPNSNDGQLVIGDMVNSDNVDSYNLTGASNDDITASSQAKLNFQFVYLPEDKEVHFFSKSAFARWEDDVVMSGGCATHEQNAWQPISQGF